MLMTNGERLLLNRGFLPGEVQQNHDKDKKNPEECRLLG
jgi:cytochrome oxidase assembly protein ShyY1